MVPIVIALFFMTYSANYNVLTLTTVAPVWDVVTEDLNQDGIQDILAVCVDKKTDPKTRSLVVFLTNSPSFYPKDPSLILQLDNRVGALFLAEFDGTPPRELVVAHAKGATIYGFQKNSWEICSEIQLDCLFPTGVREPVFLKDTAKDLNGDGIDEWFIPVHQGFLIFNGKGTPTLIRCDVESEIRRGGDNLYIYHRLPAYHIFPNNDGLSNAIAMLSDEYADFAYGENWQHHKRFKIPLQIDEKWDAIVRMADIDKNNIPDLIVTQTKGTVNLLSLTQIYLAKNHFEYNAAPDFTFEIKGALTSPFIRDVNGDHQEDLIFIKIPVGVRSFVNYFVRRKLTVEADVYLFKSGKFDLQPDYSQTLVLDAPEGREQVAYTMGDFNGDKLLDVALGAASGNMVIYVGVGGKFLSPKPWATIEILGFGVARAIDLDKNGCDDILIFHPAMKNDQKISVILF